MAIESYPVWSIPPDWAQPVAEGLEWMTFIATGPTGVEQRQSVRRSPRRYLDFNVTAIGVWRRYFDALMTLSDMNLFYLPMWHDVSRLRVAVTALDTTIRVMGTSAELAASTVVFIQGDRPWNHELAEVDGTATLNGDLVLTLTASLSRDFPYGTRVFPCQPARFLTMPSYGRVSDNAIQAAVRLDLTGPNDWAGTNEYPTYRSFPVIDIRPDEGQSQGGSYFRYVAQVDNQVGLIYSEDFGSVSFSSTNLASLIRGRIASDEIRSTLYALRGRAGQAWFIRPTTDFNLTRIVPAHATSVTVDRNGFYDTGGANLSRQDIRILMKDGTEYYRRVTSGGISPYRDDWEVLNLDAEVTSGIDPRDVIRISFMLPGRLDADLIELSHQTDTDGAATVSLVFRAVPDQRSADDWEPPPLVDDTAGDCAPRIAGFWARINDGAWNGSLTASPSFRSGAVPLTGITDHVYPVVGFNTGFVGGQFVTVNFGGTNFLYGVPDRAAAWGQSTSLDPDHAATSGLTLTADENGSVVTATPGSEASGIYVRASSSSETQFGLRYFEVLVDDLAQNNFFGFCTASAGMGPRGFSNTVINDHGILLAEDGHIYLDGADTGVHLDTGVAPGDVVGICIYTVFS